MKLTDFRSIYLTTYRTIGLGVLASITLVLFFYGFLMLFFMQNDNWVAPTILSQTSDKMLQFQSALLSQEQIKHTIEVQKFTAERQLETYRHQLESLIAFKDKLDTTVHNEARTAQRFAQLKCATATQNDQLIVDLTGAVGDIQKSRDKGLITKTEATQTLVALSQFQTASNDNALTANALSRQARTLSGKDESVDALGAIRQQVELNTLISTAKDNVAIAEKTVDETQKALGEANTVLDVLQNTAYMQALTNNGANLAFLPYDNIKKAKQGDPIYDCHLLILDCYQVGTIDRVYNDEQVVEFPIFNVRFSRTVRGTLISMNITNPESMHTQILFFGHKPFLF